MTSTAKDRLSAGTPASAPTETGQPVQPASGDPEVRFRMRILQGGTIALGPGKVSLLEAVREHGSISAAARSLNMSYRRAWLLMDELNRSLKSPATISEHGGQSGGGSMLTPVGDEIIRLYREIEARAAAACASEIAALTELVKR
ncbi:LysR family transcriptional regulator [Paraburkholderia sp.]|uniref:winged helix-turn-helix domain-containing protein n=1 Tax=Paraburkholderia sp. TaxID=1926495 RepID=UPI0025DC3B16|nr:LysR family transcriptional regulator [Paraburkholderia sp.]